jgi:hypothetical protein
MKIEVGEIIYIIDSKNRSIIPVRVNEQVVTKKIDGETITHNIELPNNKIAQLESLKAKYFNTIYDVRAHLLAQAEELINDSILEAEMIAKSKFSDPKDEFFHDAASPTSLNDSSEKVQVKLPDGQMANVKVPPEFLNENLSN